jgi:hypothetical protein
MKLQNIPVGNHEIAFNQKIQFLSSCSFRKQ